MISTSQSVELERQNGVAQLVNPEMLTISHPFKTKVHVFNILIIHPLSDSNMNSRAMIQVSLFLHHIWPLWPHIL